MQLVDERQSWHLPPLDARDDAGIGDDVVHVGGQS